MTKCKSLTINGNICKNNKYNDNDSIFSPKCYIHYKKKYLNNVITISRYYRGYRARRYLKIYTLLPRDLQYKIQFYIREPIILKNHHYYVIKSILSNRFYNDDIFKLRANPYELFEKIQLNNHSIHEIYRLYNKYYMIADSFILRWLNKVVNILISLCTIYKLNNNFKNTLIDFYELNKKLKIL